MIYKNKITHSNTRENVKEFILEISIIGKINKESDKNEQVVETKT